MTKDDKKAWDSHYRFIEQDILSGYWRLYIANPEAYKFAFQAGRDSKGDGWCFDMDKAPLQEPCEIACFFEGEAKTKITFLEDSICAKTGKDYGGGISWSGVSEYLVTVYAWRLSVPPPLPQDRKEGN